MKKFCFLIALAFAIPAFPQGQIVGTNHRKIFSGGAATQFPGWTYYQESYVGANQNGGSPGCSSGTTCTMKVFTTQANSARVLMIQTTNNVTISQVCETTGTSCSGNNNGWTLCPASSCHANQDTNIDMAYTVGGATGDGTVEVTLSGASGANFFILFEEVIPPSGQTASFDKASTATSASCTSCSMAVFSGGNAITATDAIVHFPNGHGGSLGNSTTAPYATPYFQDMNGLITGLNVTSASTAVTYGQTSGAFQDSAIAFKSSLGSFTPSTNLSTFQLVNMANNNGLGCNPNCTLTIPSTGSGHLGVLMASTINGGHLTAVTGAGTSTIPSGANTCQITLSGNANDAFSCAYILSTSAAATSLSITSSSNSTIGFVWFEFSRASGSFALDYQNSQQTATTNDPTGVATTLTGANGDIVVQAQFCAGGCNAITLYPIGTNISGVGPAIDGNSSAVALLNTLNGAAPEWGYGGNPTMQVALAFK